MRVGLREKYALSMGALIITVSLVLAGILLYHFRNVTSDLLRASVVSVDQLAGQQLEIQSREYVRTVADRLAGPLASGDAATVHKVLHAVRVRDSVRYVLLLDPQSRLMSDGMAKDGARLGEPVRHPLAGRVSGVETPVTLWKQGSLHVAFPVRWEGRSIGELFMGFSRTPVDRQLHRVQAQMAEIRERSLREQMAGVALLALALLLAGTLLAFRLAKRLSDPIRALASSAEQLGRGGNGRFELRRGDELGDLAEALSAMQRNLHRSTISRELLEREVAARTGELSALNRELESFSYSISHDLRAPLRALNGFSLALMEDFGGKLEPAARDYLVRIRAATERMNQMVDGLLTLSRVTRGELNRTQVQLSAMAEEILADLAAGAPDREVESSVAPGLDAQGDPALLHLLLQNLLVNAWKFTSRRQRARIEVGARPESGETVYFVRDNGAGFEMELADRLFQPFQRLHGEAEFAGTGIGLATVARIVARHGGRVWAEGAPDQGAAFYFTLGQAGW